MSNLTLSIKNGIQLAIDKRGEIFITLNGYIKLSGKPKQTISERTIRAMLAGKVKETKDLKVPGRGYRPCSLIPSDLACEWLEKDNPELAKAVDGDLFGFLQQPIDLAQFHKKAEIVPAIEPVQATENLERFDRDGIELFINRKTGEAWATVRGYARMSKKAQSTVQSRLDRMSEGERNTLTKMTEIEIPEGVQGERITLQAVRLIPAKLVFKWAIKDNPQLAEAMGAAGATVYIHQLAGFKIDSEAIAEPKPTPSQPTLLSPIEATKLFNETMANLQCLGFDIKNPRFNQSIQDWAGDILGFGRTDALATNEKWLGVAERAEQLGYSVALVVKHRSQLGKWVAERVGGNIKENRLCNGTQRPINVYPFSAELDEAIVSYLDQFA